MNGLGDSDDVYLEGEASRFRWLRAPATNEIDSGSWLTVVGAADRPYTRKSADIRVTPPPAAWSAYVERSAGSQPDQDILGARTPLKTPFP